MMATQGFAPHPGMPQQHPGVPPGHNMAPGMVHNPSQPGSQPGGIPPHLAQQMGVSAPGGQVNPAALMGGMPGGPNAHAMQHLNPQVHAQMFGQAPVNMGNFAAHSMQQQRLQNIAIQQQRQHMMAQQMYQMQPGGVPMGQNGYNPSQLAQLQAMQVRQQQMVQRQQQQPTPQQQAMLQAQQQMIQQQQQQAHQANQQHMAAQGQHPNHQMHQQQYMQLQAMQAHQAQQAAQQAQAHAAQQAQAQQAAQQQQQQQGQAQQQQPPQPQPGQPPTPGQPQIGQGPQASGPQPNQGQPQGPNAAQPSQQQPPTTQAQAQPNQPGPSQALVLQQQMALQQAQAVQAQAQAAAQKREIHREGLLTLMSFMEHLSGHSSVNDAREKDIAHWSEFVDRFFSRKGVYRTNLLHKKPDDDNPDRQVEMVAAALPHYFNASGAKKIELQLGQGTTHKPIPAPLGDNYYIENQHASLTMWFDASHVVHFGTLRIQFDAEKKVEMFEFISRDHEEYVSRNLVVEGAKPNHAWIKEWQQANSQENKSPEMSKKSKARPMKSPARPPPDLDIPHSAVKSNVGITEQQLQFIEIVEVMGAMNPLFHAAHQHPTMGAYRVLEDYVNNQISQSGAPLMNGQAMPNGQVMPNGPRTPGFGQFPLGASPHAAHLQLPGSPHIGSPAAGGMQAPAMQMQHSQQGTSPSGPSATTSPAGQKRRRPSGVKTEEDTPVNAPTPVGVVPQMNGVGGKKPQTPRMQKKARIGA